MRYVPKIGDFYYLSISDIDNMLAYCYDIDKSLLLFGKFCHEIRISTNSLQQGVREKITDFNKPLDTIFCNAMYVLKYKDANGEIW